MSHHDGSKPYQPRRGPVRPPQPSDEVAAPPPAVVTMAVDHLAAVAAEAEALNRYTEEQLLLLQGHEQVGEEEEEEDEKEVGMEEDEDEQEGQKGGVGGEHVPLDADAAAAMNPHGGMVPGAVPPMANNQLTLSFQGKVYVFNSVSPDKVQAVFLLLGGRELHHTGLGGRASSSGAYSKRLNFSHRVASQMRFRDKWKERNFDKKIRHTVRKEVALRLVLAF
ncbi:unnamed protein product [Urochloa humidicola]